MFSKNEAETQNMRSILEGLDRFYSRCTGTTVDPIADKFFVNKDGVMNNNLHFLQDTQQEGKPNADATTEGQSVLIIGYLYCYLGTGEKKYLELAEWYWSAYVEWWYKHQPIPETPSRWICNWIINGKEPVLANYPRNELHPTHGGFKGVEFNWENGMLKIPHGAPHWGEYLDVATFAFDGVLSYDSIKASVKAQRPDGGTDWDTDGQEWPVDWVILWNRKKVNWDGDVLSENHTLEEVGTVKLQDTSVNGIHKFNYATRNPVEHGGYLIDRNEPFHNRPIQAPLGDNPRNMGNAADGEVWFLDACYLMWKVTGNEKYKKALDSVHYTANEYTFIDSSNKFFRRDSTAKTPFTEGISYYYTYPDAEVNFSRNEVGYIVVEPDKACEVFLEQKSVVYRVNRDSKVRSVFGGQDSLGNPVLGSVEIAISDEKSGEGETYTAPMPPKTSTEIEEVLIPLTDFVKEVDEDGEDYLMASESASTDWGSCLATEHYTPDITGPTLPYPSRTGKTVKGTFSNEDGGLIIGFWLTETERADVRSIIYRSDTDCDIRVEDNDLWQWHWKVPSTNGEWAKILLPRSSLVLNSYQGEHPDTDPRPSSPNYTTVDQLQVSPSNAATDVYFEYYCVNEMPPAFDSSDAYVVRYTIALEAENIFTGYIGNCDMKDPREDYLAYSPGLIPFSNIYEPDSNEIGPWHGLPYPAYQAPSMYALGLGEDQEIRLENSIQFMYDAQQWYFETFGTLGPTAQAYVWDRWDSIEFGEPDTFTNNHWGDGKAWDGYQPRTFSWMCRCWQQLHDNGQEVPLKLRDFCQNWITYLWEFTEREDNPDHWLPYTYPTEGPPSPIEDDFNAGMGGLYLSGCCLAGLAGCNLPFLDDLISRILVEFEDNYTILPKYPDHVMNGSYTAWYGGYYFYGFHGAEALKGIGSYLMYKNHKKGDKTNYTGRIPKGVELAPPMHNTPIRPEGGGL